MTRRVRLCLFAVAASGLAAALIIGFRGLPPFGGGHSAYGNLLLRSGVHLRHATDLVTALNFDFRGFDTLGEEFLLFASVVGVVLILREMRDEGEGPSLEEDERHRFAGASEALRTLTLVFVPVLLALGVYIVVHGQLTPGGGFQGGIILATAPLFVFLAGRHLRTRFHAPHRWLELGEALGALGYGAVGVAGLILTGVFFKNFLPLGTTNHLLSGGQIGVASTAVGVEVSGAFLVAWSEFLDQALIIRRGGS